MNQYTSPITTPAESRYKSPFPSDDDDKFFVNGNPGATVSPPLGATEVEKSKTTFKRKNAGALEGALAELGVEVRYNVRAMRAEYKTGANNWVKKYGPQTG